jgi:hypothetical protein
MENVRNKQFISFNFCPVLAFCHCNKIPQKSSSDGRNTYLAYSFRVLNLWSLGSIVSGPVVRQNIIVETMW